MFQICEKIKLDKINSYCIGILYATSSLTVDGSEKYYTIRNNDRWYVECIATVSRYRPYKSKYMERLRSSPQWILKARDITELPTLDRIADIQAFCRAYIELHGLLDFHRIKGAPKLRLRIYGKEQVLCHINEWLPASVKKIQTISKQNGTTYNLTYQSQKEVIQILQWLDGTPRNEHVWEKWSHLIDHIK